MASSCGQWYCTDGVVLWYYGMVLCSCGHTDIVLIVLCFAIGQWYCGHVNNGVGD